MSENQNPGNLANRDKGDRIYTARQGGLGISGGGPDYDDPTQEEYAGPKIVPDDDNAGDEEDKAFKPMTEDVSKGSGKQTTDAKGGVGVLATNAEGASGAEEVPEVTNAATATGETVTDPDEKEVIRQGKEELKEHPQSTLRSGKAITM
ncbi:hypothetical protein OC861_005322 [Tilletia horrida]|nr:hypothetical protein OC861_005322 [Tilletia horrida]